MRLDFMTAFLHAALVVALGAGAAGCLSVPSEVDAAPSSAGEADPAGTARADVAAKATSSESDTKPGSADDAAEKVESKLREIRAQKRAIKRKAMAVEIARLGQEKQTLESPRSIADKQRALGTAREKLEVFETMEMPQRRRDAELDLQSAEHRLLDAREELEQLVVMYEDSELEDRTSEIVLNRGRRQLEMAEERLALQRQQLARLERDLAIELRQKREAVDDAGAELAEAERDAKLDDIRKQASVQAAEDELAESKESLEKLEKELVEASKKAEKESK